MNQPRRPIADSSFIISSNGFADGPSQALRDYLVKHRAKTVITVAHPLVPEGDNTHVVTTYRDGQSVEKVYRRPHKPPFTYLFDLVTPLFLPKATAWIGFNNLATLRGLKLRALGRTQVVVHWAVDFVPDRFGKQSLVTRVYNVLDRLALKKADFRVELSPVGITSRNAALGLKDDEVAPGQVVPMGAWLDRTPKVTEAAWDDKRLVYLGHLTERQGVDTFVKALAILAKDDSKIHADIVGAGPMLENLRKLAAELGVTERIKFHGFVKDHRDVETVLASGFLAIAPYQHVNDEAGNFVQFSDAGKLKAYLGASLPIVLTDVPSNARELEKAGAAVVVEESPEAFAAAVRELASDRDKWLAAWQAAATTAQEFDWNNLLKTALANFGFDD